jgi:hypothetical protein
LAYNMDSAQGIQAFIFIALKKGIESMNALLESRPSAILNRTDLSKVDFDETAQNVCVNLDRSFASAKSFWMTILHLADCEHATSIHFFPSLAEKCLWLVIDGEKNEMIPPPKRDCRWLLRYGIRLLAGRYWKSIVWRMKVRCFRRTYAGTILLDIPPRKSSWTGVFGFVDHHLGVVLTRQ